MFNLTSFFLLLTNCILFVSCTLSSSPISDYSEWCEADQSTLDERGVSLEDIRQGLLADYNNELSKYLAVDPEELAKSGLGIYAIEDTLYYKNHINRNKFFERMYPGNNDAESSVDQISSKESCFYSGIDHCYALLVLDLYDGMEYVTLPFLLRPEGSATPE